MVFKFCLGDKTFITNATRKRSLPRMVTHVNRNSIRLGETLKTYGAFVGLFFSVGAYVMSQDLAIGKWLTAEFAFMRFNTQVDFHVRPYVLFQDFFAAYLADTSSFSIVGFLEVVRFHVLDIAVFVRHHFVANRTLKAEFVFRIVLGPNVIFQRFLLIFKDFSAKRAVLVPGFWQIV